MTFQFLILAVLLLLLQPPTTAATTIAAAPTAIDFIRSSCNTTLYPDVCYDSLSRYASTVSQDSGKLATVAISVTLSNARRTKSYFSDLTRNSSSIVPDTPAASAIHDCFSTFSDAVSQMHDSLSLMRKLVVSSDAGSLRFRLSDVQTWMSAALTNEDTCSDGFEAVDESPLKSDASSRVDKVMKLTSNALALVNAFASSVV